METIKTISAILSVIIGTSAFYPYIRDIFLKRTQPHAYTWLIWGLTQGVAVAGLWYGNGGLGALELTVGTALVFVVFLFSLKYGTRNITLNDTVILIIALLSIVVWWQLDNPVLAVIIVCVIDAFGYIPSLRKSWGEPWSETLASWALFSIGNVFAVIALTEYNALTLLYLMTITIGNLAILVVCLIRRKKILKQQADLPK